MPSTSKQQALEEMAKWLPQGERTEEPEPAFNPENASFSDKLRALARHIRKGGQRVFQIRLEFFETNTEDVVIGACAFGAAHLSITGTDTSLSADSDIDDYVLEQLRIPYGKTIKHPLYPSHSGLYVSNVITDLNDRSDDSWTFEEIALYLESEAARIEQEEKTTHE